MLITFFIIKLYLLKAKKLYYRLVDLRQHCEPAIADKAPKLLQQLIQNAHVRSTLASLAAFQALIPIVKGENKASQSNLFYNF